MRVKTTPSQIQTTHTTRHQVHLSELHLDQNQLKSIPDSFGSLKSLTVLRLDQNQLTALPASLGDLLLLKEFSVRDNYLREIPAEICRLSGLTYLGLGYGTTPPALLSR